VTGKPFVPYVFDRAVRFDEVDAALMLYYPRFLGYCHEAMEAMFAGLDGGYPRLIKERRLGLPAVHVDVDFKSPLRYGDVARIRVDVVKTGRTSIHLRYTMTRADDERPVAVMNHVCVSTDLDAMKAVPIPPDVLALLGCSG
jgi:4-hydroxybenzoyl-CoA thioesterase